MTITLTEYYLYQMHNKKITRTTCMYFTRQVPVITASIPVKSNPSLIFLVQFSALILPTQIIDFLKL